MTARDFTAGERVTVARFEQAPDALAICGPCERGQHAYCDGSLHFQCECCGGRDIAAPDALGLREEVAEVLGEHMRGDWSDRTYSCQGCRNRFEDAEQAKFDALNREPTRAELVASRNAFSGISHPGWSLVDYNTHVADALLSLVERREAEAAKRALRDAASDVVADCSNQPGPCICTARHWLRDRADRIGGTQ